MQHLMSLGFLVVLLGSLSSTCGDFVGQSGDVHVRVADGTFECDKIECPKETYVCEVVKQTIAIGELTRTITCFSRRRRNVLKQEVFHEEADASQKVDVKVIATRNSIFGYSPASANAEGKNNNQNDRMDNGAYQFFPIGWDNGFKLFKK